MYYVFKWVDLIIIETDFSFQESKYFLKNESDIIYIFMDFNCNALIPIIGTMQ